MENLKFRRGVTLVEVMMVLGVMAFLLGIIMQLASSVHDSSRSSELVTEVDVIHEIAKNLVSSSPGSQGCCSGPEIHGTGELPSRYWDAKNEVMVTPNGGLIDPHAISNGLFLIWVRGLTTNECVALATTSWGPGQTNLNVNNIGDYGAGTWPGPQATQWCASQPSGQSYVAIGWNLAY